MKKLILIFLITLPVILTAQDKKEVPKFGISFSGFVKTDIFRDSRQSTAAYGIREGHFYLFPDAPVYDKDTVDINAEPSLHILSIQSRLTGKITGPDAFGAKTSGMIEAEFFGTSDADLNGFRLRHGFVKLDWENCNLIIGQTWHPMFPAESFPATLSFNTGAPFIPFSRNPQVRFTRNQGPLKIKLTAYAQRDFATIGPDGGSNKYLRNSALPAGDLQLQFSPDSTEHVFTLGADIKTIRPELMTSKKYFTDEMLTSTAIYAGMKLKFRPISLKMMAVLAENASDIMMIGGFGISDTTDIAKGYKEYVNYSTASFSLDIHTNGKRVQPGIFCGYSKNLGTSADTLNGNSFGRGLNVDYLFRISPRLIFTSGKLSLGVEYEITTAAYGLSDPSGTVSKEIDNYTNKRLIITAIYMF